MMRKTGSMLGLCLLMAGGVVTTSVAWAQAPLEVKPDGQVTTSGMAALDVSPKGGQRVGQTDKWQMLDLDHTLTALLAEDDVMFSISPRRGGDVFLMFVLKNQEINAPALTIRFSNGYEVKGFHYTGIINRGTQWGCYVDEAVGRALFDALAASTSVSMEWTGGKAHVDFEHGDAFVRELEETAQRGDMPFPK